MFKLNVLWNTKLLNGKFYSFLLTYFPIEVEYSQNRPFAEILRSTNVRIADDC